MLERRTHENGVVTYQSPLLNEVGVVHAFSTRIGGVSPSPFESLNLGNPLDCADPDPTPHIEENFRKLQEAIGAAGMPRAWVRQVHGRAVELLDIEPEGEYAETLAAELRDRFSGQTSADALVTNVPGVLLTIRIADCVPILIATTDGRCVAAVHAGWRGVTGNVVAKAVRGMQEVGVSPDSLVAAIGPCISLEQFEVGEEVAEEFDRQEMGACVKRMAGMKPHINLQKAVAMQLLQAGVSRIDTNTLCTVRDEGDFYSHRRDHGKTGRLAAVIAAKA